MVTDFIKLKNKIIKIDFFSEKQILQILILNENVKKSAYVTEEHLEGLLPCM